MEVNATVSQSSMQFLHAKIFSPSQTDNLLLSHIQHTWGKVQTGNTHIRRLCCYALVKVFEI